MNEDNESKSGQRLLLHCEYAIHIGLFKIMGPVDEMTDFILRQTTKLSKVQSKE